MTENKNFMAGISLIGPSVMCSYCGKTYSDEEKTMMGLETDNWAICFKCFRKSCDKVLGGIKK